MRLTDVVMRRLDPGPGALETLRCWLSEDEHRRAARFRFARDRRRFIVGRARLRELLGARLGMPPESIALAYGRHGKPALGGRLARSGWRFNVSHSGEVALYAFSRGDAEIGVDLEAVRPLPEADRIAAGFFSPRESEAYARLAPHEKCAGFFRCWTRKEAFVKALGGGLSIPLDAFDASRDPTGWRLESFTPLPGFIAAVARARG
jgi:4'-phosphopantetheinyl transferase